MQSILNILSLLLLVITMNAQVHDPVSWTFNSKHISGDEYMLTYQAKIDAPWTVYSQFTSEGGPVPTSINYETEGFDKVGVASEQGHKKEGYDKMFEMDVIKFLDDQPFIITQKVKAKPGTEVSGYLTYMTCNAEMCLPPTDVDFSFTLNPAAGTTDTKATGTSDTRPSAVAVPESKAAEAVNQVKEAAKTIVKTTAATAPVVVNKVADKMAQSTPVTKVKEITTEAKGAINNIQDAVAEVKTEVAETLSSATEADPSSKVVDPVKWDVHLKALGDDEHELTYTARMTNPWTVYSQYTSDDGPVPTTITYESVVEKIGEGTETGHKKEGYDKMFETEVIKFLSDEPFVIKHKIKSSADKLKGYLTYMTCDDTRCLPPTDVEFAFDLKSGKKLDYNNVGAGAAAIPTSGAALTSGAKIDGNTIDNRIPQLSASYKTPVGNCIGGGAEDNKRSLLSTFIFGFLGGLIALLTPCVFPMIPLTVSFFTKDTKRKGWVNGLIYGLSIIVIYVALGIGLTALFGDEALNRLSTNWIANTAFFLIFLFFAFSFFGYYEIRLPSSWSTKSDTMADKGGLLGIFFMAFTLALVSFSCTGPIIGSAIVSAASSGSSLGPAIVMGGFALGLALPFGVFAAVPALLNSLPRSGGWMNSVKVVLGFLELALAFKFLSVADMTNHWGFLRYELFMVIWILCFAGLTAYLFGKIKFPHDSPIKKLSITRKIFAFLSLAFTIYLATGLIPNDKTKSYNSKAAMSGLAPPSSYNFFLDAAEADKSIKAQYPSYTMCANSIPCFKDYYEGKAYAAAQNKPVFLDFTGHGCVNCRKTEELIWVDDKVRDKLIEDWVLVSLYVDDDKKLDNVYVSKERKKKIRNVGNMWADFQILNFEQNSQPLYVMMTHDEKVLAKPRGFKEGIQEYVDYMDCGMETYINTVK